MELLDVYKDLCSNRDWYDAYCSTGEKSNGKIMYFFNTNYRKLLSFQKGFSVMKNIENIERSQWKHHKKHGEEIEKQHTVNMLKSKLFSRNTQIYYKSQKGVVFDKISADLFNESETWLLTFFIILNGYFNNVPNYIFERTKVILQLMEERGVTSEDYFNLLEDFITKCDRGGASVFCHDYLYYDTFYKNYDDIDFLKLYIDSTNREKNHLQEYVDNQPKNSSVKKDNHCTISYKYKNTGSYTKSTLIDNARIQYFAIISLNGFYNDYIDYYNSITDKFSEFFIIDKLKVLDFIKKHSTVYELIYKEAFNLIQYSLNFRDDEETDSDVSDVQIGEKIDDTDIDSVEKYNKISSYLKKLAKINSSYRCELENLNDCHYFTSKESHKNYVEVHHLIPRAVGNDFDNSIEVVENYVALCPHCHRLVHLGEDLERKPALNYLFNKREELLRKKGLVLTKKELLDYYQIEK